MSATGRAVAHLSTSPLGVLAALLLVLSVALGVYGGRPDWFVVDGVDVTRTDLRRFGLDVDDGTMPAFTAASVAIYSASLTFASWLAALSGWPERVWSRLALAIVLVATGVGIFGQSQDQMPGSSYSNGEAYVIVGTGVVTGLLLVAIAGVLLRPSRPARCLAAAIVPLGAFVVSVIGLGQLLQADDRVSLTAQPVAGTASMLVAALSLVALAAATHRFDRRDLEAEVAQTS